MTVRALRRGTMAGRGAAAPVAANTLYLPGTSGNYVSTPDSVPNSITQDFDIRIKVRMTDWTPAARTYLLAKWPGASQRSYRFAVDTTGELRFNVTPTSTGGGTAIESAANSDGTGIVATGFADGTTHWVRVTYDRTDGTNTVWSFYTSEDYDPVGDTGTWTQLGVSVLTAVQTAAFNSTGILELGSSDTGTVGVLDGNIYYVQLRDGINGTIVQTFDATAVTKIGTRDPATVATGGPWTINGSAWDWVTV